MIFLTASAGKAKCLLANSQHHIQLKDFHGHYFFRLFGGICNLVTPNGVCGLRYFNKLKAILDNKTGRLYRIELFYLFFSL
jgi:hypothetical protein